MPNLSISGEEFMDQVEAIVLTNVSNELFGVSELAQEMNMSRSSLLRKIKSNTQLSASQFIRQVRLKKGMQMRMETSMTVSEISYEVGFSSTSYFIKCFRELYGYPPGEVGKTKLDKAPDEALSSVTASETSSTITSKQYKYPLIVLLVLACFFSFYIFSKEKIDAPKIEIERTIAVLPFKNESTDSSNLFFVNGLMESTLNSLQKIEDLKVTSRTSVEQYRNSTKNIKDISQELGVNYLVEGSGQRDGNLVLLNIQLIKASSDRPIWFEQYKREVVDIFDLQNEMAKKIADAIKAIVTPAELEQINKKPTENNTAYEYYLKALDPFNSRTEEGLTKAISLFNEAVKHDSQFALAYANIAISYYFLDLNQKQKKYTDLINSNADKALLYDPKYAESLIAKALYYMHIEEYRLALPHLEKALEYNPNSSAVVQMLAGLYALNIPNTSKYLKYALKGIQLDIAANDSISKSYIYLHLSNSLVQNGFTDEAIKYIDLSLSYFPQNYFAYAKPLIHFAKTRDLEKTEIALLNELKKDTTRSDILQEIVKYYYYQEDYATALSYYNKLAISTEDSGLEANPSENLKMSIVFEKMGFTKKANEFIKKYETFCEEDQSIYRSSNFAALYTYQGEYDKAIEQLKIFTSKDNIQYWALIFMEIDPLFNRLQSHPQYDSTIKKLNDRFWKNQSMLRSSLIEAKLL